ncbi:sugar diacid recognition domain-containing protein [Anaerocolumna aminovalerica]|uniref:Transcriptional regulator, CdaR family n=1 Tax=Anaerocolumna aminovalerica TaxID=1527 RepID=A0A1I5FND1_9FIRM|nr:sugar diacid recognition domain-containing protein [Anaerocolumna aminovalerica]MBU5331610.1 helix-turn-helix domain-containing protein [Anaerocolumna aminovalerica]MDU6265333.1 sugar diacid recognition domain-containing protein [Anaerocolumna aminovalerica]SFO25270.1 transcriptional regulator, CdaR family [Anaerocolumna aminovalerica]
MLSVQIASNIVKEVNSVIPLKINIMNEKGIIIASSDPLRIGSFHEGALRIIENQIDEIAVHYDGEFNGALQGINYPLKLQGYIIGVLGITGKYEEIVNSALIIKRMTELILENTYSVEQKQLQENVCNRYLSEWLNGEAKNITTDFVKRGKALGFDITIPRRILVCSFYIPNNSQNLQTMQVIEQAEKYLKKSVSDLDALNLYYKAGSTLVCAVTAISDSNAETLAKELKKQVEEKFPVYLAIGIDSKVDNFEFAQTALIRAQKANKACMRTHKRDIRFYDDLNMEVFTDEISELSKQEFIHRIFKGFSNEEIRHSMILLETLYDLEGSINKASERLFIHKNTLQNKLKRIAERTGYDPRSIRHSSLFYIAIYFYRDIYDSMQYL